VFGRGRHRASMLASEVDVDGTAMACAPHTFSLVPCWWYLNYTKGSKLKTSSQMFYYDILTAVGILYQCVTNIREVSHQYIRWR
jgi:hypothetical protein